MAYIDQKLHEAKAWGGEFEVLPPGDYAFQIVKVEQENSSQKGTPTLVVHTEVISPASMAGRKLIARYYLTEGSRGRLKSLTDATGVQLDDAGGFDDEQLIGLQFSADVVNEVYEKQDPLDPTKKVTRNQARVQNERPFDGNIVESHEPPADATAGYPEQPQAAAPAPAQRPAPAPAAAAPRPAPAQAPRPAPAGGITQRPAPVANGQAPRPAPVPRR